MFVPGPSSISTYAFHKAFYLHGLAIQSRFFVSFYDLNFEFLQHDLNLPYLLHLDYYSIEPKSYSLELVRGPFSEQRQVFSFQVNLCARSELLLSHFLHVI